MKIVLIQPKAGRISPEYIHEPLNLGYLASYLIEKGHKDVSIIVGLFEEDDNAILKAADDADIIGFTATSPMVMQALRLAKSLKDDKKLIVMGGSHASSEPEHLLNTGLVDIAIRGEGEVALEELVSCIDKGEKWRDIHGISFKDGSNIIHNQRQELIADLDSIPFPARDLFDQKRFIDIGYEKHNDRGIWILSSRGCPYRCTYCSSHDVWTRKWRERSAENIVEEILYMVERYGANRINFADDTFTVSKKRLREFGNLLVEKNVNISWGCNVRVDTIDESLLHLMKKSGCKDIWIGVESGSPRVSKIIKKDIDLNKANDVFRWAKEAGLKRRGYFMVEIPGETVENIIETERFVEEVEPDTLSFSIFTPYPGCDAYKQWKEEGVEVDKIDWSNVDLFETVVAGTDSMSAEEIKHQHERLCAKFKGLWKK